MTLPNPEGPERSTPDLPQRIERRDIRPGNIEPGGTEIVLQRHGVYVTDPQDEHVGSLTPDAIVQEHLAAQTYFEQLLASLPSHEADSLDVLVIASDTQYMHGGRRSLETGEIVLQTAREVLQQHGLDPGEQVINNAHPIANDDGPRTKALLREPQMFEQTPDFVAFLREKYPERTEFWIAFESDTESRTRIEHGAEGPDDITDRMVRAMSVLARYARWHHKTNPGRRLVIWAATHYDTISPFVKREILGVNKDYYLGVDYGSGVVVDIDPTGAASTTIAAKSYDVPIN